ncbi:NOG1 family protein [Pyrococcus abyssi]|uniref:GTP-binding protein, putative n=1 Tax=Pyrococcus abyssi (strain GE5 / Orsay) TaxID=272844 RepID=Q9V0G4_PYRAB|nr:NOG1 family protein [Pyrococcus abyssi]CAB49739.1 GTP-binding protein, putative [Pyrococcus abyssi GE5]CCE70227.1 TPA: gtp1/obg family GTP-binding protein [Pyrococcus abyssi GE5]
MRNPFERMPTVLTADELIDKAFRRAERAASAFKPRGDKVKKARQREELRIRTVSNVVRDNLRKVLERTPGLSTLPKFYQELVDVLVDRDTFHKAMAGIDWAIRIVRELEERYVERIRYSKDPNEMAELRRQFYGRVASVLRDIDDRLRYLNKAREVLKDLPVVDLETPTVVIAGHPNVGKSTLLKALTTAKPEIASYPFTTRGINVGQFEDGYFRYQVIDTPGLLDRPLSERNEIEKQAILALKYLGNLIIYIFDPSEYCGFPLEEQIHLFNEIYEEFKDMPFLVVINKIDVAEEDKIRIVEELVKEKGIKFLKISALKGEGVDKVREEITKTLRPLAEKIAKEKIEEELRRYRRPF